MYGIIWVSLYSLKMVQKLDLVMNAVAELIIGTWWVEHDIPLFQLLHWVPIPFWSQFMVLLMIFKALHDIGLGYFNCLPQYTVKLHVQSSHMASLGYCCQLQPSRWQQDTGPSVLWHCLWNQLPENQRPALSLYGFQQKLKHTFHLAFEVEELSREPLLLS